MATPPAPVADVVTAAVAHGSLRPRLLDGFSLEDRADGLHASTTVGTLRIAPPAPSLAAVRRGLETGETTLDGLTEIVSAADGPAGLTRFYLVLEQLAVLGALAWVAPGPDGPLATLVPAAAELRVTPRRLDPAVPLVLSRFASLHRDAEGWILDCPLGRGRVRLHDARSLEMVLALGVPRTAADAAAEGGLEPLAGAMLLQLLANAEALTPWRDGAPAEDADPVLALWSTDDLTFHARSRYGRHTGPFGAGFRHIGTIDPLPAVRPSPPGPMIELPRPDLAAIAAADPSLTDALEGRRSIRPDGTEHLTLAEIGEFLYRTARVRWQNEMEVASRDGRTGRMEVTSRPYPAGGRAYELEVWLSVRAIEGLEPGLHHYDPLGHRLVLVRPLDRLVTSLIGYASIAAPGTQPGAVIHLAARFGRVAWKYDAIAYATILKHVGVLYQTMYLVATAMGLSACALGSGNADLFATAAGTDPRVESSVGDFLLGGRPTAVTDPEPGA